MRTFLTTIAAMGIIATANIAFGQGAPSIEGTWLGTTQVTTGANASTNPKRLPTLSIFTKTHYSVLAQDASQPRPPRQAPPPIKTPGKPTDAEKIALYDFWAPVIAHSGTYQVKGNTFIQRQMVAKGVPTDVTFEFKFADNGKTLITSAKSAPGQPASETIRTFTRVE